jgi:hypothetical protein
MELWLKLDLKQAMGLKREFKSCRGKVTEVFMYKFQF